MDFAHIRTQNFKKLTSAGLTPFEALQLAAVTEGPLYAAEEEIYERLEIILQKIEHLTGKRPEERINIITASAPFCPASALSGTCPVIFLSEEFIGSHYPDKLKTFDSVVGHETAHITNSSRDHSVLKLNTELEDYINLVNGISYLHPIMLFDVPTVVDNLFRSQPQHNGQSIADLICNHAHEIIVKDPNFRSYKRVAELEADLYGVIAGSAEALHEALNDGTTVAHPTTTTRSKGNKERAQESPADERIHPLTPSRTNFMIAAGSDPERLLHTLKQLENTLLAKAARMECP